MHASGAGVTTGPAAQCLVPKDVVEESYSSFLLNLPLFLITSSLPWDASLVTCFWLLETFPEVDPRVQQWLSWRQFIWQSKVLARTFPSIPPLPKFHEHQTVTNTGVSGSSSTCSRSKSQRLISIPSFTHNQQQTQQRLWTCFSNTF